MATLEELKAILTSIYNNPTGCRKDYNTVYRSWKELKRLVTFGPTMSILDASDIPDKPNVSDYEDLDCQTYE